MALPSLRLQGRYAPTLLIALVVLVPYILVTSAARLYEPQIGTAIGISQQGLTLSASFATAGYAFGALLGGDLVSRFRKRRLFPVFAGLLAAGWVAAALATDPALYAAGTIVQGFATGILLVVALPPTIQNFRWQRVPLTAAFINIGLFGAVAAGPLLGGAVAAVHAWRWLYGGFAMAVGIVAVLGIAVIPDDAPPNPDLRFDWPAMLLGLGATVLPFGGVALVASHGFAAPIVYAPLGIGIACFFALLLLEYHHPDPLAPVKRMWNTLPVIGTLVATIGGGVFVTLMDLALELDQTVGGMSPIRAGAMFWPQLAAVLVAAVILGLVFASRYVPVLLLGGMLALIAGGVLLLVAATPRHHTLLLIAVALLGLGAGATVSPGLFLAGFALKSKILGRIVALVELIRSVGDFLIAPVMLQLSKMLSGPGAVDPHGIGASVAISLAAVAATTILCVGLYLAGGLGLPRPRLACWLDQDGTALDSPPLLAAFRRQLTGGRRR